MLLCLCFRSSQTWLFQTWLFAIFTRMRTFAPFYALLRSCDSFALICALLCSFAVRSFAVRSCSCVRPRLERLRLEAAELAVQTMVLVESLVVQISICGWQSFMGGQTTHTTPPVFFGRAAGQMGLHAKGVGRTRPDVIFSALLGYALYL